jgi:hypothetical protein
MLWQRCHERVLVGLERDDLAIELAQHLLARQPVLVDVAAALGCFCSGVTPTTPGRSARVAVMSLEPPRTSSPVVDSSALSSLESPYPSSQPPRTDVPHPATSTHLPTTESEQPSATPVSRSGADVRDPTMPPLPSPRTQRAPLAITPARVIAIMGAGTTVEPVDVAPRSFPGQLTAEQFPDLPSAPGMPKGDSLTSDQRRDILTGGPTTVADRESREDTEHTATLLFPGASGRPAPAARSPARTPGRDFPAIRSIGLEWATLPRAYMPWRPRVKRPGVRLASKRRFRLAPTGPGETVVTASTPIDAAQPPTTAAPPVQPRQTAIDEMRVPAHAVADELARAAKRDRGIGRPLWTLSRLVLALAILALIAALIRWRMF